MVTERIAAIAVKAVQAWIDRRHRHRQDWLGLKPSALYDDAAAWAIASRSIVEGFNGLLVAVPCRAISFPAEERAACFDEDLGTFASHMAVRAAGGGCR